MFWKRSAIPTAKLGAKGERRARWFYRLRGYRVLEANVKLRGGELDLVVQRGRTLVFVEVKTRQSLRAGHGYHAVDLRKQFRLVRLVDEYLATRVVGRVRIRYDVMSLFWNGRWFEITRFEDAFRPEVDLRQPWRWRGPPVVN